MMEIRGAKYDNYAIIITIMSLVCTMRARFSCFRPLNLAIGSYCSAEQMQRAPPPPRRSWLHFKSTKYDEELLKWELE